MKLEYEAGRVVGALRALVVAVCRCRADGAALLDKLAADESTMRMVLDERSGTLSLGIETFADGPVEMIEVVVVDTRDAARFGTVLSQELADVPGGEIGIEARARP